MKRALIASFVLLICLSLDVTNASPEAAGSSPQVKQIVEKVLANLKTNEEKAKEYGFFQETVLKELEEDGTVSEQKKRTYRIIWIDGEPYAEMIRFNDLELTAKLKKEEEKRRSKFIKSLKQKKEKDKYEEEDELSWEELLGKYDFRLLPLEGKASYVISFTPRAGKLKERTRTEKIYNNLSGTLWVGPEYSLLKVAATLSKNVRFGLGLLGNVQDLELSYSQKRFQDIWIPDQLYVKFKARIFISAKNQEVSVRFYDPYKRTAPAAFN